MYIVCIRVALRLRASHSLKEKRMVARRLRARLAERYKVAVNEVGALDRMQRLELGFAVCSATKQAALELAASLESDLSNDEAGDVIAVAREVVSLDFDEASEPTSRQEFEPPAHWLLDDSNGEDSV